MGYYHIKQMLLLLCTIVFPLGKYKYKRLPIGIKIPLVPDAFQKVMSKLVQDIENFKTYLGHLLMLTNRNSSLKDHLLMLEVVLARLATTALLI
jgi:hypothetical protein